MRPRTRRLSPRPAQGGGNEESHEPGTERNAKHGGLDEWRHEKENGRWGMSLTATRSGPRQPRGLHGHGTLPNVEVGGLHDAHRHECKQQHPRENYPISSPPSHYINISKDSKFWRNSMRRVLYFLFLVLCPICNSSKTVCNILPKNSAGATPLWRQSPGAAGAYGRTGRKAGVGLPRHSRSAFTAPQPARRRAAAPCRSTGRHDPGKGGSRPAPPAQPGRNPTRRPAGIKNNTPRRRGSLQGAGMRATASVTHRARRAAEPLARRPGPASPG